MVREFKKSLFGLLLILLSVGLALSSGCKSPVSDENRSVTVNLSIKNHYTCDIMATDSISALTGQTVQIDISDYHLDGVSQDFGVVLGPSGSRAAYTFSGALHFTVWDTDTGSISYTLVVFDTTVANSEAAYVDITEGWGSAVPSTVVKNLAVYRQDSDGRTGPESVWTDVFTAMNAGLGGLGSFVVGTTGTPYGYADCYGGDGSHSGGIFVDSEKMGVTSIVPMTKIGIAEAFEKYVGCNNILDNPSSMSILKGVGLNELGKVCLLFGAYYAAN